MKTLCLLLALLCSQYCLAAGQSITLAAAEYPPYTTATDPAGGLIGAIARAAFAQRGISLRLSFRPWVRALSEVQNGHFDGLLGLWYSQERSGFLYFSLPIYNTTLGFFSRCDHRVNVSELAQLRTLRIGTVQGYKNPDSFEQAGLHSVDAEDDMSNLYKLAAGRLDLVLIDREVAQYLQRQAKPALSVPLCWEEPPLEVMPLHIAFSRHKTESGRLLTEFSQGLTALHQSGEYERILRHYGATP
ncbi:ABC transporter substrate-binding protein [Vogesella sp. LIG4]|uniref:substrate-binding periplasmic protein n=1 Tax=Vogesella sp. LIG4 TaxID=1192162 RepID=UPI00081FEFC6|nr:transporter substrate-binding domain-containing protein [Vogesella sp. LIG4]SCK17201.1 amino acid ABC transporter substrate-binding protein, PAAT family [Vogesella sp. LIG4]